MIITTTMHIENKPVQEYKGIVFGEVVEALDEMSQRASKLGANAIIGVSFQYSTVGAQNGMLMITCNGTAVVV